MEIYVKISLIFIFSFFPGFHSRFSRIYLFYTYRSFRHSNWWSHNL